MVISVYKAYQAYMINSTNIVAACIEDAIAAYRSYYDYNGNDLEIKVLSPEGPCIVANSECGKAPSPEMVIPLEDSNKTYAFKSLSLGVPEFTTTVTEKEEDNQYTSSPDINLMDRNKDVDKYEYYGG